MRRVVVHDMGGLVVAFELYGFDFVRPGTFDVFENQHDVAIAQLILIGWHGVGWHSGDCGSPVGCNGNQIGIIVVPGMPTSIVGWGGVAAIGVGLLPIGLAL